MPFLKNGQFVEFKNLSHSDIFVILFNQPNFLSANAKQNFKLESTSTISISRLLRFYTFKRNLKNE